MISTLVEVTSDQIQRTLFMGRKDLVHRGDNGGTINETQWCGEGGGLDSHC